MDNILSYTPNTIIEFEVDLPNLVAKSCNRKLIL